MEPLAAVVATPVPAFDEPAARLQDLGAEALSTRELLCLLMGGSPSAAGRIANEILARAGSLSELARLDVRELRASGLSLARASRVVAALELGRRALRPREDRVRVDTPEAAAKLLLPLYQHRDVENFGELVLDSRHGIVARRTICIGSMTAAVVHPREVLRPVIQLRGAGLLLYHNHPSSGDPTPSPEDLALTRRLVEAARLMGIEIVDHLILGDGRFLSLRSWNDGACWR